MAIDIKTYEYLTHTIVRVTGLAQDNGEGASGAYEIDLSSVYLLEVGPADKGSIQVENSATPSSGTLQPAIQTPRAGAYGNLTNSIDMVNGPLIVSWTNIISNKIKVTPTSFDGDKTYSVTIVIWR